MKCIYLLLCSFLYSQFILAQATISGKITDSSSITGIEYATVILKERSTQKVIDGTSSNNRGIFEINGIRDGVYTIIIDFIGYDHYTIDNVIVNKAHQRVYFNDIKLKPVGNTLSGVIVTTSVAVITNKIDKIVYNAANDITAQGGVALDILKKVPQVSVGIDGNVELQGNPNIRFLINGKPSSIFGSSLADALSSIPASQIKSIEAITSPGAKYDAQGTGGIINIILKETKVKSINGSINLSAGSRTENASVNLNIRSGNFGVNAFFSGNASLNSKTPYSQLRTSYNSADQTTISMLQDGYNDVKRRSYQSGLGFDWDLSKSDLITGSFLYNNFSSKRNGIVNQQQAIKDVFSNPVSEVYSSRNSGTSTSIYSLDWSLSYKHKFRREGEELEFNYNSSLGRPDMDFNQSQTFANAPGPFSGSVSYNTGTDDQSNLSLDYVLPLIKEATIEAGVKSTFQNINSTANANVLSTVTGEYNYDPLQSYVLNYKMNIYAGYVSASFSMFKFLDVKGGLRLEHTDVNIGYGNTKVPSYNTYVPSVILAHSFTTNRFLKLSYAHRIERPEYEELNPFLNLSDPYNITTGNPLLQPEIGDNLELGYNHSFESGANFYVAISERVNSNDIKQYVTFYPSYTIGDSIYNNVSITARRNIGTEYNSAFILNGSLPIVKGLNVRANFMLINRHIVNSADTVNSITNGFNWRLNVNASYELPASLLTEAFGNYRSASNSIQGKMPQNLSYTFAIRKQFWNKKASVGITATNIFSKYVKQVTTINTGIYDAYNIRELPLRSVGITFTYKFGKLESKPHSNRTTIDVNGEG